MVSRRKILSRSRDDLNLDQSFIATEEEEDVWYQKDKLFKEHIQEVLDKWTQIDDEIWAKVIVFERNRRVAKAYARAPVLTINGSDDGFDGMRIGLCGFDNPMRDPKTEEFKQLIGQGVKIKMDDAGNILIRRYAKSNVFIKSTASSPNEETSIGADILKLPHQALESEKIVKLFDMKKFQSNVNRELRRAYPDRRRLETQCLSIVAFVKSEQDVLDCPIWVLIVNVVAMDMLKSKLPPVQRSMIDIRNRPRIPIPDEDPYSVAGNGSAGSSGSSGFSNANPHQQLNNGFMSSAGNMHLSNGNGLVAATREQLLLQTQQLAHKRSEKPPKLPPRDNLYSHGLIPKPDYDDVEVSSRVKFSRGKSDKGKDNTNYDDPYYCGLRARVPNFAKSSKSNKEQKDNYAQQNKKAAHAQLSASSSSGQLNSIYGSTQQLMPPQPPSMNYMPSYQQQRMWQNRSYDNSIGIHNSQIRATHARDIPNNHYKLNPCESRSMPTYDRDFVHRHKHVRAFTKDQKQTRGRQIYVPTSYQGNYTEQDEPMYSRFQRSYSQIGVNCSCHSCIALAPLFDELTRLRPLYQEHQLRNKKQLELALEPEPESHLMKWRSESDISAIERQNDDTEIFERNETTHKTYNYGSENNLYGSILNIETVPNNSKQQQQQRQQRQLPVDNYAVCYANDNKNNKKQQKSQETILRDARSKSLSNESFFEKPTEQGCYIYEGRKRIQSVPSKTEVLCENVHSALQLQTANIKRCISQLYMQTKEKKTRNHESEIVNAFHQRSQNLHNKFDDKQTTSTSTSTSTATSTTTTTTLAKMQDKTNISLNTKNQLPIKSKPEVIQNAHLSISDMESIYGYLKPRKQRSLSLKRIQIIEQ